MTLLRSGLISSALAAALLLSGALGPALAQGTVDDYERSAALGEAYRGALQKFRPALRWTPDGKAVWWRRGKEWVRVGVGNGERRSGVDPVELGLPAGDEGLAPLSSWGHSRPGGEATAITFKNEFERSVRLFWVTPSGALRAYGEVAAGAELEMATYGGHVWVLDFAKDDLAGIFEAADFGGVAVIDEASAEAAMAKPEVAVTEDRPFRIELRGLKLFGIETATSEEWLLADDATAEDRYRSRFHWSPDGRYALGFQETVVETRKIPLVESSPDGQLQPRFEELRYRKPGDEVPQRRPRLFDLQERRAIAMDDGPFEDSWSVGFERWSNRGDRVFVNYNARGHGRLAVLAIDPATGAVTDVIDERSATFVDYSQKRWIHWIDSAEEVLWASERDGWNHLYRIDSRTGRVIQQITQGEWLVRKVERVDEEMGQIWFTALGIREGQDPYHQHLVRVDIDGKNLTVLTEGDGTHEWTWSPDGRSFIDRWSRVDQPQVTELRRAADGALIVELGRDSADRLEAKGYVAPERFAAPGRDGKTPIWGVIYRPSNYDPKLSYPVLEEIYAGPHGHFVPKKFGLQSRQRRMAELGFIVVQIDGMGTNWRSRAFHGVAWQNLKDGGFPDRIAWMRAAAAKDPAMDLERVGIYGGSAGGQNAMAALLHHGDFYDAAVADCGCHDNRMDKIWWNEAWMGRMGPHYADSSNVTHAKNLAGDLFLTVGELDRNVDPASTMQVVDALIKADKDFDFVIVPGAGHGIGESPYLFRRRMDFFVRKLWGTEPRGEALR